MIIKRHRNFIISIRNKITTISCIFTAATFSTITCAAETNIAPTFNQQIMLDQQRTATLQQQQEQISRNHAATAPTIQVPSPALTQQPSTDTPCFTINRIYIQGELAQRFGWALSDVISTHNQVMAQNIVRADIAPQCLGAQGISNLLKKIQNDIIVKGYITTRVLTPSQNLKSGNLVITLIPGRVRHIRYIDTPDKTAPWRSQLWNIYPSDTNDLLNLRRVEQALENMKRVPTVDAKIQIAPSGSLGGDVASVGDSDLLVGWQQSRPVRLQMNIDDSGTKQTGKYLASTTLSLDNPFHLNDLFYINYTHDLGGTDSGSRGTHGYSGYYSIPLGFSLLTITSSQNEYHQTVFGNTQNYIYSGDTTNKSIKLSQVVYRDAFNKTTVEAGGWFESSHNLIDGTNIDVQRRRTVGWLFNINQQDHFGLNSLELNLGYKQGTGVLGAVPAPEEVLNEGTSRLRVITADAQLRMPFTIAAQNLNYTFSPRAQWNETPLPFPDRFSIGGRYTVRGFDGSNVLTADRGWTLRNDLGLALGQTGQELYLGLDGGHVSGQSAALLSGQTLIGSALGIRGGYKHFNYDLFAGWPLKKPENFQASGVSTGFNLYLSY